MSIDEIDALLERMPKIAAAVNSFESEAVQHEVFVMLISAFKGRNAPRSLSDALMTQKMRA